MSKELTKEILDNKEFHNTIIDYFYDVYRQLEKSKNIHGVYNKSIGLTKYDFLNCLTLLADEFYKSVILEKEFDDDFCTYRVDSDQVVYVLSEEDGSDTPSLIGVYTTFEYLMKAKNRRIKEYVDDREHEYDEFIIECDCPEMTEQEYLDFLNKFIEEDLKVNTIKLN